MIYGSGILAESSSASAKNYLLDNETIREAPGILKPIYWVAMASDGQIPRLASSILEQPINDTDVVKSLGRLMATSEAKHAAKHAEDLAKIAELGKVIDAISNRLDAIIKSRSWRVTAPMRKVSAMMRRAILSYKR